MRFLLLALPCAALAMAAAPPAGTREDELAALRLEITRLQARAQKLHGEAADLAGELERTGVELELQARRIDEAKAAQAVAMARLAASDRSIAQLEQRLTQVREELQARLLALHRLGRAGYLRLLLALGPQAELLPAMRELRFLARRDAELLDRVAQTRARLASERDERLAMAREAEAWLARETERRAALAGMRQRQAQLLGRLQRESETIAVRSVALADRERKLASFLDYLYGRGEQGVVGAPMQQFRGVLDWPVSGRVLERFGPRLDPRYRTRTPHNGVDLATRAGDEVRSIYPGKVAWAAEFQGYGPTVIVQHAGRVFTLYAGLARVRVTRGDVVALQAPVGDAGERLYFEIRVENRPEDPLAWVR